MEQFKQLVDNIYRLEVPFGACWTGVTLVRGKMNILVDSGDCAQHVDEYVVPALNAMGLSLEDIDVLAMTHTHGDHIGGAARMKELSPSLKIAVYEGSLDQARHPLVYNKKIRAVFPEYSAPAAKVLPGVEPDILVRDGEKVGDLRLLFTPGHDADTCCWLDERTLTLITGDSLQLNGTNVQGCALIMYLPQYEDSLHRLLGMELCNIVCGHDYLPLGAQAFGSQKAHDYLLACRACVSHDAAYVAGMMDAGVTDAPTIARALIREVGGQEPEYLFLPLYTATQMMERKTRK